MAFAGLKKQINKANQYVTEKMGGAEGTKLDLDFMDMERKTDVTVELVEELQIKTKEFLQPNPTARAKMAAVKGISKLSGQAKSNTYPQPEGLLADCMLMYGKKMGENSIFADALIEMGESLRQMADVKYSLDDNIKQNFLEPLHALQMKDLKEVMYHRKKLQGRRLDYDCKRRRQAKGSHITDDEIRGAEEKFAESLHLAQVGMFNLLDNDVEQVSQLTQFSESLLEYHQQCTEILKILVETLQMKREEAANAPKGEFVPKTLADLNIDGILPGGGVGGGGSDGGIINGGRHINNSNSSHNLNRTKLNSHNNIYSSQQNLSKINQSNQNHINSNNNKNNNNIINTNSSNFSRNRMYGSQQSLSTVSNRSSNNSINRPNYGQSNNTNNSHVTNMNLSPTDVWINAWNTPDVPSTATTTTTTVNHNSSSHYNHNNFSSSSSNNINNTYKNNLNNNNIKKSHFNDPWTASPLPSPMRSPARTPMTQQRTTGPCCTALYDFEPENPGELGFKENDVIQLLNKVDENWFEGSVNGRTGYFPQSYVQIVTPLP